MALLIVGLSVRECSTPSLKPVLNLFPLTAVSLLSIIFFIINKTTDPKQLLQFYHYILTQIIFIPELEIISSIHLQKITHHYLFDLIESKNYTIFFTFLWLYWPCLTTRSFFCISDIFQFVLLHLLYLLNFYCFKNLFIKIEINIKIKFCKVYHT